MNTVGLLSAMVSKGGVRKKFKAPGFRKRLNTNSQLAYSCDSTNMSGKKKVAILGGGMVRLFSLLLSLGSVLGNV